MLWLVAIGSLVTAAFGTAVLWSQNNWMVDGGAHDLVVVLPLMSLPIAVAPALGLALSTILHRRGATAFCSGALACCFALIVPATVFEIAVQPIWITTYPSRIAVFASAILFGGLALRLWWTMRARTAAQ